METRGTETPIDAAVCGSCGTVFVPSDEIERYYVREQERTEEKLAHKGEPTLEHFC